MGRLVISGFSLLFYELWYNETTQGSSWRIVRDSVVIPNYFRYYIKQRDLFFLNRSLFL